jgi:hypothetical protein
MFLAEIFGNSLYTFSDVIIFSGLRKSIKVEPEEDFYEKMIDETKCICDLFQTFCFEFLLAAFDPFIETIRSESEEINLENIPSIDDVKIPYFVLKD